MIQIRSCLVKNESRKSNSSVLRHAAACNTMPIHFDKTAAEKLIFQGFDVQSDLGHNVPVCGLHEIVTENH